MATTIVGAGDAPDLPTIHWRPATLVSLVVGAWIAVGELNHVLGQVISKGRSWTPSSLSSPTAPFRHEQTIEGWTFFDTTGSNFAVVHAWLWQYALADIVLAVLVAAVAAYALGRLSEGAYRAWGMGVVAGACAADVAENLMIATWLEHPRALLFATSVKWLLLVPAAVMVLWKARHPLRSWVRHAPRAAYTHRYSILVVAPLAALGLARGPDLLEQIPDIQRAWADDGGHGDFVVAALVTLALTGVVFVIGRQRTHHLWQRTCPSWTDTEEACPDDEGACEVEARRAAHPPPRPLLRVWLVGPVVLLVAALVRWQQGADVSWLRLGLFCAVPLVVVGVSLLVRWRWPDLQRPTRKLVSRPRFLAASWTGDLLAGLLPIVAGLGAIRAFTAVLALDRANAWAVALFVLGWLALALTWPVGAWLLRRLARAATDVDPDSRMDRLTVLVTPGLETVRSPVAPRRAAGPLARWLVTFRDQWVAWAFLVAGILIIGWVAVFPVGFAEHAGVIATFQLALGALSVAIAATVILMQAGGAPEAFWKTGPPFAPVTSLLLVVCVFIGGVGQWSDVHGIRTHPDAGKGAVRERPALSSVFTTWLTNGDPCATELPGAPVVRGAPLRVRPLLLYAAEGGGIRAAYWTTAAIDKIATSTPVAGTATPVLCRSAMVSSGASGGSVGLSIASVSEPGAAAASVKDIAGPEALGAAADGLVLRDPLFAATGVPLPSLNDPDTPLAAWADRGTLIEQAWERGIPALGDPFLAPRAADGWDWGPTGALVLNSTSTTTLCRTLISQVALPTAGSDCRTRQSMPGSTDLVACTGQLATSTAALLTARFPYVTPSGVVTCRRTAAAGTANEERRMQIVDGGYAENTGVGTLLDLVPDLLARVRQHNSCVLDPAAATTCVGEPAIDTLVVPQLVYFDNGTGSDLVASPRSLDLEFLVPPLTLLGATASLYSAESQLERARGVLDTDQLWDASAQDPRTAQALRAVNAWRGHSIAVVYQATRPAVAAPLGWMLSKASIDTMDVALCHQKAVTGFQPAVGTPPLAPTSEEDPPTDPAPTTRRFGNLNEVLRLVGSASDC